MFLLFVRFFSFYNLFLNLNLLKSIRIEQNRSSNFVASKKCWVSQQLPECRENIVNLSVSVKSADFIGLLHTKFNNCFSLMLYHVKTLILCSKSQ